MTIPAQSQPDKLKKTPLMIHRRNHSGELDVFEAAGYFSGYNEQESVFYNNTQKLMRRTSLDSPVIRNTTSTTTNVTTTLDHQEKQKPLFSSPGSKIATFFNSLFNQNKKTKASITKTQSFEEDGVGKRKRRSSINGYFRSSTTTTHDQYYSKSGFRTPPVTVAIASSYDVYTPTKSVKNHKHVVSSLMLQNVNIHNNVDVIPLHNGNLYNLLDEELKLHDIGKTELNRNWVDPHECAIKEKEYCFNEDDDGAESDSDLFELKNCDLLGTYSTALPVC
ncbi:hypothetical protein ACFE04_017873 [Oxalis oulophora]